MRKDNFCGVVATLLCFFFLSGCGGGGGGATGSGTGQTGGSNRGSISITIRWPGEALAGRLIPPNTSSIKVEIVGENLPSPLADTKAIAPVLNFNFMDVPMGSKTVTVSALDSGGNTLAMRKFNLVVGTGSTTTDVTLGVSISDNGFTPRDLAISSGDKVMWGNDGDQIHTVTADSGAFNSGDIAPGGAYTLTFATAGDVSYHCSRHPFETGRILVRSGLPGIASISQATVNIGSQVTLTGSNFGDAQGQSTVTFIGVSASVVSWSSTQIVCIVPNSAGSGNVVVTVSGATSNGVGITILNPYGATSYAFAGKWGSWGSGDGQFQSPQLTAVDTNGNVYVADMFNNRIEKFNSNGGFITKWGSFGTGDGQFNHPVGVAVDAGGNVYVADMDNNRIQKFSNNGIFTSKWGSFGAGDGQFNKPTGIAVDASGNVYVADWKGNRIQKFGSNGGFLAKWGGLGNGDGQFNAPFSIAVDSNSNVYVSDQNNNRIQKFNSSGGFITKWGATGTGDGGFDQPLGIAADATGNVYVADFANNRIQKFSGNGAFMTKWGSAGAGDGQFNNPYGIAVDTSGNLYVTDANNHRVQKFKPEGVILASPTITGVNPNSGTVGAQVTFTGTSFGAVQGQSTVTFNGVSASAASWSDTQIKCTVPNGAITGNVVVTVAGVPSNGVNFTVTAPNPVGPVISGINPSAGAVGSQVTLTGSNFGASQGQSTVAFNGVQASATSWSDNQIVCTVPNGAATGNVTVTVSGVSSNGMSFSVWLWKDYIKSGQPFRIVFDAAASKFNDDGWVGANDPLGGIVGGKTYVSRYEQATGKWVGTGYSEYNNDNCYTTSDVTDWGNPDSYQINLWQYRFTYNEAGEVFDFQSSWGLVGHLATHDWRTWIQSGQPFMISFDRTYPRWDDTGWLGYGSDPFGDFAVGVNPWGTLGPFSRGYKVTYNAGSWTVEGYAESMGTNFQATSITASPNNSQATYGHAPWGSIAGCDPNLFQINAWGLGFRFNALGELMFWDQPDDVFGHLGI